MVLEILESITHKSHSTLVDEKIGDVFLATFRFHTICCLLALTFKTLKSNYWKHSFGLIWGNLAAKKQTNKQSTSLSTK